MKFLRILTVSIILLFSTSCLSAQIPQDGLIAYYPFNGNANDESGNGYNGTVHGNAALTADRFGNANKAYSFDGVDDWIETTYAQNNLSAFSVSVWVRTDVNYVGPGATPSGFAIIQNRGSEFSGAKSITLDYDVCCTGGWNFGFDGDFIRVCQNKVMTNNNQWMHIVGVWESSGASQANASQFKIYINGVLASTTANNTGNFSLPASSSGFLKIARHDAWNTYYKGDIDDLVMWDRALTDEDVQQLFAGNGETTIPTITLSKSIITTEETIVIEGKGYTPNKKGSLNFSGAGGIYQKAIVIDGQGNFSDIYEIPLDATKGYADVRGYDSTKGIYSGQSKTFEIQLSKNIRDNLELQNPGRSTFPTGSKISISWQDILQRKYGTYYYPMEEKTGMRLYRYRIEYQTSDGGAWQLLKVEEGKDLFDKTITKNVELKIDAPTPYCRFQVVDDYVPTISKVSEAFSITSVTNNLDVTLQWDKSFPPSSHELIGVAADGTARLLINVKRKDASIGSPIQSVEAEISDGENNNTNMLGKLFPATTNEYILEANSANSAHCTAAPNPDGACWIWYVAPDDFSESSASINANRSQRKVVVKIKVHYANGQSEGMEQEIIIVRPPLVLAHGLASSAEAWDKFGYSTTGSTKLLFKESPLFKYKKPINLSPRDNFLGNANRLLFADFPNPSENSLQGNIYRLREKGFACNQVDYVAHSMGGSVLRTAITVLGNKFYAKGGSRYTYQNYEKGFVHKAITISTPHLGSPVADAIKEYVPYINAKVKRRLTTLYGHFPDFPYLFEFLKPVDPFVKDIWGGYYNWTSSDAVTDLQVDNQKGGIDFFETRVKSHLIAGDVNLLTAEEATGIASMRKYLELLDDIFDAAKDFTPSGPVKNYLKTLESINDIARGLSFIEWYSATKGFPNFLGDGDLIVPLKSATANLPLNAPNVTVIEGSVLTGSLWNINHTAIKNRIDVGNRVLELLNSPISSNLFGVGFPATPNRLSVAGQMRASNSENSRRSYYDTSKIKIFSPTYNNLLHSDSTIVISYQIKDTVGLDRVEVLFQDFTYKSFNRNATQTITTQLSPSFPGKQILYVTAVYYKGAIVEEHTDTTTVQVEETETLVAFKAEPKVFSLVNGETGAPSYTGASHTNILSIPANTIGMKISVSDTTIIKYDLLMQRFIASADTGSTYAVVEYRNFRDTVYFTTSKAQFSGCVNRAMATGSWDNPAIWEKGIVPSSCDSVVIIPNLNVTLNNSTNVRALMISRGSTLNLADSSISIHIGFPDDGSRFLDCSGTLNLMKGSLFVNGALRLNEGSSFNMSGGKIIIDGNTGYPETSIANGIHLFEASPNMSNFSLTGGKLQLTDPPLGTNSQAISCPYNFGDSSILQFGDGVSTTASNNPDGFGGNLLPPQIGQFVLDAVIKSNNRHFINKSPLSMKSPVMVKSGNLIQSATLTIKQ